MAEFLFEIGLEEVPARMIASAQAELERRIVALLERERLVEPGTPSRSFSTPRRLAVWVGALAAQQADSSEELTGPATKIAFKEGVPTPAAHAFASKAGVEVSALKTVTTPKGEYLAATIRKPGRPALEVIAEAMPKELAGIYWAKNMYWRPAKPERFVRPVRWLLALLGEVIVPIEFGGKTAGRVTYGHRVLAGDAPIPIGFPDEYQQTLLDAKVIVDVEARRRVIRKSLDHICRSIPNTRWREDTALVDKLTHLTEWPTAIAGAFENEYLSLPEEVLVTVMRDHQSYFAVEAADGKLAPHFLAVLNTEADAKGEAVIRHGNERVLRARFNDARFFWEFDQRVKLAGRVELLEKVTFQKDLGSYAAKSARVLAVAERIATMLVARGSILDGPALIDAVRLAKTDLTTDLVKEFTELQGKVGGLYALAQGYSAAVADAIYDHYLPKSMEDSVPRTPEGAVLALADKVDTIAAMFGLGLEPTGSKDPFALRRAANGIVKILAEAEPALPLTLGDVVDAAAADEPVRVKVEVFLAERLEFYLREAKSQAYDVVKAVLAVEANDVRAAIARAEAVTKVRGSDDFVAVSAALKRTQNILAQAEEKGIRFGSTLEGLTFTNSAEKELVAKATALHSVVNIQLGNYNFTGALESIASIRPEIDLFFASVMVMDPDEEIRRTRLTILSWVKLGFGGIADFSEIVSAG